MTLQKSPSRWPHEAANWQAAMVKIVAPMAFEAWVDYSFSAHTFSRMEMLLLQHMLRTGGCLTQDLVETYGLSVREKGEYLEAITLKEFVTADDPRFSLDPVQGLPGSWFEEEAKKYLPRGA